MRDAQSPVMSCLGKICQKKIAALLLQLGVRAENVHLLISRGGKVLSCSAAASERQSLCSYTRVADGYPVTRADHLLICYGSRAYALMTS